MLSEIEEVEGKNAQRKRPRSDCPFVRKPELLGSHPNSVSDEPESEEAPFPAGETSARPGDNDAESDDG